VERGTAELVIHRRDDRRHLARIDVL